MEGPTAGVGVDPRRDDGDRRVYLLGDPTRCTAVPRRPRLGVIIESGHADVRGDHRLRQGRIKRALAGRDDEARSATCLAAGLGPAGYAFAILGTCSPTGFFKRLVPRSGAVIHGLDRGQDMRHYGGLR